MRKGVTMSMADIKDFYQKLQNRPLTPEIVMHILAETCGGSRISVPTLKQFVYRERDEKIRRSFRGGNYEELAIRFRLSPKQVRRIVHKKY